MSKPRYMWYGFVQKRIRQFPNNLDPDIPQDAISRIAIQRALSETEKMTDGNDRLRLVKMLYFDNSHTMDGAADVLHISERTAQRWNSKFVYLCGEYMGYK